MEQKDYLLREIEKIGLMLRALLNGLFGDPENLSISLETRMEFAKESLIKEINFDIDTLLSLNAEEANSYIASFKRIGVSNIELLAEIISNLGFEEKTANKKNYLEKSLQIFHFCNHADRTYSQERENKINKIKEAINFFE